MGTSWRCLGVACAASVLAASGCIFLAGAGVGAGAVAAYRYVQGEGSKMYASDVPRTGSAVATALGGMNIVVVNSTYDDLSGKISARMRDDTAVSVHLKAMKKSVTEVRVRVGTFGDATQTKMIFEKIDRELGVD